MPADGLCCGDSLVEMRVTHDESGPVDGTTARKFGLQRAKFTVKQAVHQRPVLLRVKLYLSRMGTWILAKIRDRAVGWGRVRLKTTRVRKVSNQP